MVFRVQSRLESGPRELTWAEAHTARKFESWVHEKGYFSRSRILDGINEHAVDRQDWPGDGSLARATFNRICKDGGRGISVDRFVLEYDRVVDTSIPAVRQALEAVYRLLGFFAHFPFEASDPDAVDSYLNLEGFMRAICCHAELNVLFNRRPQLKRADRDGQEIHQVHVDPVKTASDLRRLLFRGFALPLPQSEVATGSTHLEVLQFVRHEHETGPDGQLVNTEHRVFELEDERTIELLDILAMGRTRVFRTEAPFSRCDYKGVPAALPTFKHDLRQIGIEKQDLICLVSLLSTIDPHKPGLQRPAEDPHFESQYERWQTSLAGLDDHVEYMNFDELLRSQMPHFYVQISKLTGLLVAERSEDGGYAPDGGLFYRYTASERIRSRELVETLTSNTVDSDEPLTGGCTKCWELGLNDNDYTCTTR